MTEKNHKIYTHVNKTNGKVYIGQTVRSLKDRSGHNGIGYRECTVFWKAIQKYGWDGFEHKVVFDHLTQEEANAKECELIELHKSTDKKYGYNIQGGGISAGGMSEEGRRILIEKQSGTNSYNATECVLFDKTGKRVHDFDLVIDAAKFLGVSTGAMSNACQGVKIRTIKGYIAFYKRDIGDTVRISEEKLHEILDARLPVKPVSQYSIDGDFIRSYDSMTLAANTMGGGTGSLCCAVSGKQETAYGFQWRYASEGLDQIGKPKSILKKEEFARNKLMSRKHKELIAMYDKEGVFIRTFNCIKDAADCLGVCDSSVNEVVIDSGRSCHGKVFRRVLEDSDYKKKIQVRIRRKGETVETPISQYGLDGKYIESYKSATDAARATGVQRTVISRCVRGEARFAGGFQWKPDNGTTNYIDVMPEKKKLNPEYLAERSKRVCQVDIKTNEVIREFDSIRSAAKFISMDKANISAVCNGKTKSCAGYKWKFLDTGEN